MVEEWRELPGSSGRYEVSSLGRVRTYVNPFGGPRLRSPRLVKQHRGAYPNVHITLIHGGPSGSVTVHSLVALTFHGPRPKGQQVRHLDGDSHNSRMDNLKYGTPAENADDTLRHGRRRMGDGAPWAKLTEETVRQARKWSSEGVTYAEIAERLSVSHYTIGSAVRGETWRHVA